MKTLLQSLLFLLVVMVSVESARAQVPTPSASPKLTTATCGRPVCTWNAFGPITYTRASGQPQTVSNIFSVLNPNTQFTLHIDNSGISSAVISVNGTQIFGPSDFNPNVTTLDRSVTLAPNNTVQVQLNGDPGTSLAITVIGVDTDPPTIVESETPPANAFGWNNSNVNVTFACSDPTSGVASCPSPVLLTTEGLNQMVAGTAFDLAGNSTTASIQISIDKTPPTIFPSQNPPANSFGWNNTPVTLSFLCNDNLSGVQNCTPPVLLSNQGQNQTVIGMATDFAGNSATASTSVSIDLAPPTIVATASPAANASGWNNTPVTLSFSCTDALSGVESCPPPQTVSAEGAAQNINGTAFDKAGNSASATVTLNIDETPPMVSVTSPANDSAVSSPGLQITGTASDNLSGVAAVSCNGSLGVIAGSSFTCNVTLTAGSNSIQVQAVDVAGNIASTQLSVTFNAVPPKAIFITPAQASLLVGQSRSVRLVGDIGQVVTGASWTINDPTVVNITTDDPPQLTAMAEGTTTLTANFSGLSASMTISVLAGTALPVGTPIWSLDPLPGNVAIQMVKGNPVNPSDPDIFALESPGTLRGLTADGRQLWIAKVERPAQTAVAAQTSIPSSAVAQSAVAPTPVAPVQARALPDNLARKIRAHLGSDPLQQFLERHPLLSRKMHFTSMTAKALSAQAQAASAAVSETDFAVGSVPDNNGGTVNSVFRDMSAFPFFETTLVRLDNATQQTSWSYDSPGLITGIAIAPDNTIYATEVYLTGVVQEGFFDASLSDVVAFDGTTGQQKFKLAIPPGHVTITQVQSSQVVQFPDLDTNAKLGLPSVLPDGSLNLLVYTVLFNDTFGFGVADGCSPGVIDCETAISDHKNLQLMTIQTNGSFSTQPVHAFDFVKNNCGANVNGCQDPSDTDVDTLISTSTAEFAPGEVIPDGLGGALAAWSGGGADLPSSAARIRRFDGLGGTSDYTVPLVSNQWSPPFHTPKALILGENNVAFGSDGLSIEAFSTITGGQQWGFQPAGQPGSFGPPGAALLAANADGSLAGYTTDPNTGDINAVLLFDSFGGQMQFPLSAPLTSLVAYDTNGLLAIAASGQNEMASFSSPEIDLDAAWPVPGAFESQRSTTPIHFEQTGPCSGFDNTVVDPDPGSDRKQTWLMVGMQGTVTSPTAGTNNVILASNIPFDGIDLLTSDGTKATVAPGALKDRHHMIVTVTGLQPDDPNNTTTVITAVDHQNPGTVLATLHLAILARKTRTVYPFAVSNLRSPGNSNLAPQRPANSGALQTLLESIYGTQANVHMPVQPLINTSIHYDLNSDGKLQAGGEGDPPSNEANALFQGILAFYGCVPGGTCTIDQTGVFPLYVKALSSSTAIAITPGNGNFEAIGDTHVDSTELTTAHEVGHSLGLPDLCPGDPNSQAVKTCIQNSQQQTDRIMWHFDGNPGRCRLIKDEWIQIQQRN